MQYSIGRAAKASGCKVQTIRYYEEIGLIPPAKRTEGNQRYYLQAEVDKISFIRHARALDFSLAAIQEIMTLADMPEHACAEADAIARAQIDSIDKRIGQLTALKKELTRMVDSCQGGKVAQCRVIEVLSDHRLCISDDHSHVAEHD